MIEGPRQIFYSRDAGRALRRMDRKTAHRIYRKVAQLAVDPGALANNVSALRGETGLMRLRIGNWRVIFTEDSEVLRVMKIAPRGSVYD